MTWSTSLRLDGLIAVELPPRHTKTRKTAASPRPTATAENDQ